ncbi:hypothetical protein A2630_00575 [Candidatus Woesebacteria bacterium RIFCSPHIGHO2_01_FULL_44_10]|uniref:Glycosyltransferase 2-like domain-containing protein n=1 Tax=Candidatus Woesebacteria bacterium RIFCSPLOWO2_01_FULL_44_14 TaxID=1802525 RepID=A0A1F8C1T4_9BACT|nr:MAG: hypothetical protein A2630_00575 [Candidatus Woesebacteria bacterium RIFCSPHIGHO2_01_FULL_44_10]OGM54380.1 MAG: hypothetical protein A3F62_01350 [Candidatus Woesebacteria bacterium RIFCSPHIGHO2_12_FULL_44_11]OGM70283.1 MAG: hypothetical protein A2975_04400 [Candidatus Woesebacteria bacterium RIFCSPLOWO2_01_FULL_44_14]
MNISVVIPVCNDLRLKACIDSIDEKVEVVISLNKPTKELKDLIKSILKVQKEKNKYKNIKFNICEIGYPSIAGAYNNGIKHASYENILLMDSDCIFEKGCIRKLHQNIKGHLLSKGKVVFSSNSLVTKVVARAREFHTSDKVSAYSPPLLFKKKIINKIGGYYFHPSLCWLEDSEFDKRVQNAQLEIAYDKSAKVIHPSLSPARDLKSAIWYGVGKRIGVELGIHDKPTGLIGSIKKYIIMAPKSKGYLSGLYLFTWKMALFVGYYSQKFFKIRPVSMIMSQKEN